MIIPTSNNRKNKDELHYLVSTVFGYLRFGHLRMTLFVPRSSVLFMLETNKIPTGFQPQDTKATNS